MAKPVASNVYIGHIDKTTRLSVPCYTHTYVQKNSHSHTHSQTCSFNCINTKPPVSQFHKYLRTFTSHWEWETIGNTRRREWNQTKLEHPKPGNSSIKSKKEHEIWFSWRNTRNHIGSRRKFQINKIQSQMNTPQFVQILSYSHIVNSDELWETKWSFGGGGEEWVEG